MEEGPRSGAQRSEAERSEVSRVKTDGLPVDQPGIKMARAAMGYGSIMLPIKRTKSE